jgi:hypothetical protein
LPSCGSLPPSRWRSRPSTRCAGGRRSDLCSVLRVLCEWHGSGSRLRIAGIATCSTLSPPLPGCVSLPDQGGVRVVLRETRAGVGVTRPCQVVCASPASRVRVVLRGVRTVVGGIRHCHVACVWLPASRRRRRVTRDAGGRRSDLRSVCVCSANGTAAGHDYASRESRHAPPSPRGRGSAPQREPTYREFASVCQRRSRGEGLPCGLAPPRVGQTLCAPPLRWCDARTASGLPAFQPFSLHAQCPETPSPPRVRRRRP